MVGDAALGVVSKGGRDKKRVLQNKCSIIMGGGPTKFVIKLGQEQTRGGTRGMYKTHKHDGKNLDVLQ